jgi:hypothetical protein
MCVFLFYTSQLVQHENDHLLNAFILKYTQTASDVRPVPAVLMPDTPRLLGDTPARTLRLDFMSVSESDDDDAPMLRKVTTVSVGGSQGEENDSLSRPMTAAATHVPTNKSDAQVVLLKEHLKNAKQRKVKQLESQHHPAAGAENTTRQSAQGSPEAREEEKENEEEEAELEEEEPKPDNLSRQSSVEAGFVAVESAGSLIARSRSASPVHSTRSLSLSVHSGSSAVGGVSEGDESSDGEIVMTTKMVVTEPEAAVHSFQSGPTDLLPTTHAHAIRHRPPQAVGGTPHSRVQALKDANMLLVIEVEDMKRKIKRADAREERLEGQYQVRMCVCVCVCV